MILTFWKFFVFQKKSLENVVALQHWQQFASATDE
jgi:hypothetical protein